MQAVQAGEDGWHKTNQAASVAQHSLGFGSHFIGVGVMIDSSVQLTFDHFDTVTPFRLAHHLAGTFTGSDSNSLTRSGDDQHCQSVIKKPVLLTF